MWEVQILGMKSLKPYEGMVAVLGAVDGNVLVMNMELMLVLNGDESLELDQLMALNEIHDVEVDDD